MPTRLSAAMHFAKYIREHENEDFGIEQINGLKIKDYEYNVVNNGIGETFIQATNNGVVYPFCKLNPSKNFRDNILLCLRTIQEKITNNEKVREENESELTHKFLQKDDDSLIFKLTDMSHIPEEKRKKYGGKTSRKTKSRKSRKTKSRKSRKTTSRKSKKTRKTK